MLSRDADWIILSCPPSWISRYMEALARDGHDVYQPLVLVEIRRRRMRRPQSALVPAFPGYFFARRAVLVDLSLPQYDRACPVRSGSSIAYLSDDAMWRMRREEEAMRGKPKPSEPKYSFSKGDRIIIAEGVLAGWSGEVVSVNKRTKVATIDIDFQHIKLKIHASLLAPDRR